MTDTALDKTGAREPDQSAPLDEQERPRGHRWTSVLPQIAGEHCIDIGNGRYAHFRRDRRFAQVQVMFTAPEGIDPNPGRELTDPFKELGWTWRPNEPGKPWIYQLDQSTEHDPTARGDSRDALHEQFLLIVEGYRLKHGMLPTVGWENLAEINRALNVDGHLPAATALADQTEQTSEKQKPRSEEEETRAGGGGADQALEMLDAFASVGAERFDITFTDAAGEKIGFRSRRSLGQLRHAMPEILQEAAEQRHNVIVRPRSTGATLIQLDDLGEDAAARLQPVSFLVLRTSPGNYQAWIAVSDADAGFARQLRQGAGADLTASGATRFSGTMNFKEKYAPDYPRVETAHVSPGRVATRAELEALGVVSPTEKVTPVVVRSHRSGPRGWPSYQRCLEGAPDKKDGRRDRSLADFTFCKIAIDWGWGIEETAARLTELSGKAQENGPAYALRTARAAARAVEGRRC